MKLIELFPKEMSSAEKKVRAEDLVHVALLHNGMTVAGIMDQGVLQYSLMLKQVPVGMAMTMAILSPLDCGTDTLRNGEPINIGYAGNEIKLAYSVSALEANTAGLLVGAYLKTFGIIPREDESTQPVANLEQSQPAGAGLEEALRKLNAKGVTDMDSKRKKK